MRLGNEEKEEEEKMELLNSPEDVIKLVLRLSPKVKNSLDGCFDYTGPSIQVETKASILLLMSCAILFSLY